MEKDAENFKYTLWNENCRNCTSTSPHHRLVIEFLCCVRSSVVVKLSINVMGLTSKVRKL